MLQHALPRPAPLVLAVGDFADRELHLPTVTEHNVLCQAISVDAIVLNIGLGDKRKIDSIEGDCLISRLSEEVIYEMGTRRVLDEYAAPSRCRIIYRPLNPSAVVGTTYLPLSTLPA